MTIGLPDETRLGQQPGEVGLLQQDDSIVQSYTTDRDSANVHQLGRFISSRKQLRNLHCAHAEDRQDCNLLLQLHTQLPYRPNWNHKYLHVTDDIQGSHSHVQLVRINTPSFNTRVPYPLPWPTCKDVEEEHCGIKQHISSQRANDNLKDDTSKSCGEGLLELQEDDSLR